MSNVQFLVDIPLNPGWLIGILVMACYNPNITGSIILYIKQPTKDFFIAHLERPNEHCSKPLPNSEIKP